LKAFKNIGGISFNQKKFNCITVKIRNQHDYRHKASTTKTTIEMLFDKKTVSMRKKIKIAHSSYFKQAGGQESRRLATEGRKE
jgi:hypothetical protein